MNSPYLAGFLSIVMHAPDIKSPRIDRMIRARNTWLREMQYVIVHGGDGPGTRPSWNTTDARLPFTNVEHGFLIDYPDSPGCTWTGSSAEINQGSLAPHKDCQKSPLGIPSTYQIRKLALALGPVGRGTVHPFGSDKPPCTANTKEHALNRLIQRASGHTGAFSKREL